jgi:ubiquinone/menaquinone biosynthesis C-methylase UbiE
MTAWTAQNAMAVVEAYDFSACDTVVDVGGGHGVMAISILKAFPESRGVVYDLETVIEGARRDIAAAGLSTRCDAVAGDFFTAVPPGGDLYILSQVLHDWDDVRSLAILRNCHRAMLDHGRLLVVEMVVSGQQSPLAALSDVHMMVVTGGRERTEREYQDLLDRSGFELRRIIPTVAPAQIIEAVRV